ncbi:CRISPR-associated protein Cas2 [Ferrithrix thermotolerans DSM 19514]|uniref:CRISPR-associated endoribonuclease Cas2 n=1 Tax=Ferrithrix thermotolerans DSM 19514 TaxID=1121881 RepID=A0A1M4XN33_9ACTN|nr:CRISPR-associated endonuclease Cas2 [Ferrithrix thermotolerans]SHE94820.1 CRISPR-associated protein Cas2 [Ferrithrix thermotolerans DSM 19514]
MKLRRYLVCYDIRDAKRLREIAKCLAGYGDRIQYSIYLCDLPSIEINKLEMRIERIVDPSVDSVMVVDLGKPDTPNKITVFGVLDMSPSYVSRVF